jgi:hypothetical protein
MNHVKRANDSECSRLPRTLSQSSDQGTIQHLSAMSSLIEWPDPSQWPVATSITCQELVMNFVEFEHSIAFGNNAGYVIWMSTKYTTLAYMCRAGQRQRGFTIA